MPLNEPIKIRMFQLLTDSIALKLKHSLDSSIKTFISKVTKKLMKFSLHSQDVVASNFNQIYEITSYHSTIVEIGYENISIILPMLHVSWY